MRASGLTHGDEGLEVAVVDFLALRLEVRLVRATLAGSCGRVKRSGSCEEQGGSRGKWKGRTDPRRTRALPSRACAVATLQLPRRTASAQGRGKSQPGPEDEQGVGRCGTWSVSSTRKTHLAPSLRARRWL